MCESERVGERERKRKREREHCEREEREKGIDKQINRERVCV